MKYEDNITTHKKEGNFEYLTFKLLEKYNDKLIHFITLKHGGVSNGVYKSLNVRNVGNDDIKNVNKNIEIICDKMALDSNKVYKAKQEHTDNILVLNNENKDKYKFYDISTEPYDAYIIRDTGISNFVTTADCNPIIIYDVKQNIVANVHAGWKGVIKQIHLKVINTLIKDFNSNVNDLVVCIGPSIRKCCFSSEEESFKEKFTNIWKNEKDYIYYETNKKRFHIDLIFLIKQDLVSIGIKQENINVANICTHDNTDDFYSFRKSTENKDIDYATFSTWVSLKK